MARFLAREALGKFYVNTLDDFGKVRFMWLPKKYRDVAFTIAARSSGQNWKINCHYSPIEGLEPEQCEGDISVYGLYGNSPDLPSAEESKVKFIFHHDFVITESSNHELIKFSYHQFAPMLTFIGSANRLKDVGGLAIFEDQEMLHNSIDNKNATLSVVVESWPNTAESKDVDCKRDSSPAYSSITFQCKGKTLVS